MRTPIQTELLTALAYLMDRKTPGEVIDDALDVLELDNWDDPVHAHLLEALYLVEEIDLEDAAEELTEISTQLVALHHDKMWMATHQIHPGWDN